MKFNGTELRDRRKAKKLSQTDLAYKVTAAGEPITAAAIHLYEAGGVKSPGCLKLMAIAKALGVDARVFFTR